MNNKDIFFNVCEYLYLHNDDWAPTRVFQEALIVLGLPNGEVKEGMVNFLVWVLSEPKEE